MQKIMHKLDPMAGQTKTDFNQLVVQITPIEQNLSRLEEKLKEEEKGGIDIEKEMREATSKIIEIKEEVQDYLTDTSQQIANVNQNNTKLQTRMQNLEEKRNNTVTAKKEDIANLSSRVRAIETTKRQMVEAIVILSGRIAEHISYTEEQ